MRKSTKANKVDIIGHSQGTLMPAYYVKYLGGASKVHNYISLAPLWHGTEFFPPAIAQLLGIDSSAVPFCVGLRRVRPGLVVHARRSARAESPSRACAT